GQISWLLPAALILLAAGLVVTRKAARTDGERAAFLLWGGALLMTAATFSFMSGIFHEYYNIALAPYIAALVAMGAVLLWRRRAHLLASGTLALTVAVTAVWSYVLLDRAGDWLPWLRWTVLAAGAVAALALLGLSRLPRRVGVGVAALGLAASVAGPVAYTLSTVDTPHTGSIITAGPSSGRGPGGMGGPGGPGGAGGGGMRGGPPGMPGQGGQGQGQPPQGMPGQGGQAQGQGQPGQQSKGGPGQGQQGQGMPGGAGAREGRMGGGMGGGMGGLLNGASVSAKAKSRLSENADDYTWAAAAIGSQNAASYQLATGKPVMAIGGFNGSDPSPTLAQFKKYVADGKIHYFIGGSQGGPGGGQGTASEISSWVTKHYEKVTVGQATFYDLTKKS
ncbi:glycosyl transferase, partial [Streptomyces daliensis]|nr:glycosyl transferase [Streptomyces daliensis]